MDPLIILLIVLVIGSLGFQFSLWLKSQGTPPVAPPQVDIQGLLEVLKQERERLDEKVESQLKLSEQSFESKKDLIAEAVANLRQELQQGQERIIRNDANRVSEFQALKTVIDEHKQITQTLQVSTENLKKVLSNNQLRGSFGQEVAEDLLKMAGFVKGQNYDTQQQQETGNKPDFTVFLPDGTKINIDVKFPFQALQRFQETEDKEQQKQYLAEFKTDIKNKVKEISSRDYINPEDNTVDFVIMFIPNEMIFSFIYERYPDVWKDAIKNKVVMCGPFSFTAILRMVKQSYDNFKYQKGLHNIIAQIKVFELEYSKFSDALDGLGKKISAASDEYTKVTGVRDRQLLKVIEKIKAGEEDVALEGPLKNPLLEGRD